MVTVGRIGVASPTLAERIDALADAVEIVAGVGDGILDDVTVSTVGAVLDKVRARAGHGTDHTVVALIGSTGVGKSSLFNALVGTEVSTPGVRRPTTSEAHAAIWSGSSPALLDWLGVSRRHHVESDVDSPSALDELVLIDLPDFDSTETANRDEVDRLIELVDVLIWVADPQKYADEALHHGYLRPLAGHGDVMQFVINKIDLVPTDERPAIVADFRARIEQDGIHDPHVLVTSLVGVDGAAAVRSALIDAVGARRAMVLRLESDLRDAAAMLDTENDDGGRWRRSDGLSRSGRRELVESLGHAAGADSTAEVVAAQHRHEARAAMGWPPAKLLSRWRRRQPIADLPRASASAAAGSEIDLALRDAGEAAAEGLPDPWPRILRKVATGHSESLRRRLTTLTDDAARSAGRPPRWWGAVRGLQQLLAVTAVIGVVWLLVAALLGGFFRFDTDPLLIGTPGADWIPVPSLLVLGGLGLGLLVWLLSRLTVDMASKRRGRRARAELLRRVTELADATVLADLDAALADRRRVHDLLELVRK